MSEQDWEKRTAEDGLVTAIEELHEVRAERDTLQAKVKSLEALVDTERHWVNLLKEVTDLEARIARAEAVPRAKYGDVYQSGIGRSWVRGANKMRHDIFAALGPEESDERNA